MKKIILNLIVAFIVFGGYAYATNDTVTTDPMIRKYMWYGDNSGSPVKIAVDADGKVQTSNTASGDEIKDADEDTKVQVEATTDNDTITFTAGGTEVATMVSTGMVLNGDLTMGATSVIFGTGDELEVDGGMSISSTLTVGGTTNYINFANTDGTPIGADAKLIVDSSTAVMDLSTSDVNILVDAIIDGGLTVSGTDIFMLNIPSGATQPASVAVGMLWLDTDDQTLKVGA